MDTVAQFNRMVERHRNMIRGLCASYSDGDKQLCCDLIQEVLAGMWVRYRERYANMPEAWQGAWVYWQTRHFASLAVRTRCRTTLTLRMEMVETLAEEVDEAVELVDELSEVLVGRERQLLELMRQGYRNEEIAERMGVSLATMKRVRKSMLESMRRRAVEMGKE